MIPLGSLIFFVSTGFGVAEAAHVSLRKLAAEGLVTKIGFLGTGKNGCLTAAGGVPANKAVKTPKDIAIIIVITCFFGVEIESERDEMSLVLLVSL